MRKNSVKLTDLNKTTSGVGLVNAIRFWQICSFNNWPWVSRLGRVMKYWPQKDYENIYMKRELNNIQE